MRAGRRIPIRTFAVSVSVLVGTVGGLALLISSQRSSASGDAFDLDHGNAPVEVVIPRVAPAITETVSPTASDASLVVRITTLVHQAWFDAAAPYHPTAVGVSSRLGRRPSEESVTNRNMNIAMLYATYRVLNSVLPQHAADWRDMMTSVGLDPDDEREDLDTAVGIGNRAGKAVVASREHDGMNQLGDEGGRRYNRQPYTDYLGYRPVNSAYELRDPSRWQPLVVSAGNGVFEVQQFVTPQWRVTRPYSYDDPDRFRVPAPVDSTLNGPGGRAAYQRQADEVLAASAALTDDQKLKAELFNDKIRALGFSQVFAAQARGLSLQRFAHYALAVDVALFDTGIAVWSEKHRHDAVRPVSAIRYLYGRRPVTAWGGPGRGTVSDIPANEWRSYIPTADHPEYPSGSAGFCAAQAQMSRRFFGSDELRWSVLVARGSSVIEPGTTPARDTTLTWASWSDFERDCRLSRLWGGVHFRPALAAGATIGRRVGDLALDFVHQHVAGGSG